MDWQHLPWKARYHYGKRAASEVRRMGILATHRHTTVEIPSSAYLGPGFDLIIPGTGVLIVGECAEFRRGFIAEIADGGKVEMGANCVFTRAAMIQISTSLTIGNRAVFGQDLFIADGNHRFRDYTVAPVDQGFNFRPITIGDNTLIHSKCTIVANIGRGSVIGANSVVTKPIPPYCLAAGVPARVLEYFGPPELRPEELELG